MTTATSGPDAYTDALARLSADVAAAARGAGQAAALTMNALRLRPEDPEMAARVAGLDKEQRALDALGAALAAAAGRPPDDAALKALATACHVAGRPADGAALIAAALEVRPRLRDAYWHHAAAVIQAGQGEAVESWLGERLAAAPDDAVSRRKRATLLAMQGRMRDAAVETLAVWGEDAAAFGRYGDVVALVERFRGMSIWEGLTFEDAVLLHTLACRAVRPGGVIVEIGSWLGMSTAILGNVAAAAGAKVFAIDTWAGSDGTWQSGRVQGLSHFDRFCSNMEELGLLRSTVVPVMSRSDGCADLLAPGSVDLLFIDGDHRYGTVRGDIALWSPKVRPGGTVCGHDCEHHYAALPPEQQARADAGREQDAVPGLGHCGVIKAVHEAYGGRAILVGMGSSVWRAPAAG